MQDPSTLRLVPLSHFTDVMGVSNRTGRNWAGAGHFTIYNVKGKSGAFVDLDEARAAILDLNERGVVRLGYGTYGPNAKIVTLDGAR
jgi:hypothetical protein